MYSSAEQTTAPSCGVCGRKLGVGFYFTCHICGASFCYAHAPAKCDHSKLKRSTQKTPLTR